LNQIEPDVGGIVLTSFGLARVLQVRCRGVIKCQLKGGGDGGKYKGKAALCVLNASSYQVLSQAPTGDLSSAELAQYALRLQSLAVVEAKRRHPGRAFQLYERVLTASAQLLRDKSLPQSQRGDWVIRTVKCSISGAQIAIQLHLYPAALELTKDALAVLDALERKRTASVGSSGTRGSLSVPSLERKKVTGVERGENTSMSSGDSSITSSSSSSSSGMDSAPVLDVGCVKLFGECRVRALLVTAQALLGMDQGKTLAFAALRVLEQAQGILRKYTVKPYLEHPDYKSTMKAFVSLQKDLKRLKKQAKLVIRPKAAATSQSTASPGRFASWLLRSTRRVMFADVDKKPSTTSHRSLSSSSSSAPPVAVSVTSKAMAAVVSSSTANTWTRRDTLVLSGVVAGGLVAFHCAMRRQRI
jgi:hypothetical protein